MAEELNQSLEYTPTWIVAVVCSIIVFISLCVERALHKLGKYLKSKGQTALYEALTKLEEGLISDICISPNLATQMLPCKRPHRSPEGSEHYQIYYDAIINRRRLFSTDTGSDHCRQKGKVPLLSLESVHHLHIFIFVLAVVHAIFCVTTMLLGGAKLFSNAEKDYREFFKVHADGYWRRAAVISWLRSFFKQFHGSVTKSDYLALRYGFVKEHHPQNPEYNFHDYMLRTLEVDFKTVVGISWYLWLFVVLFLLMDLEGWHTYFWLAFLPLIVRLVLSLLMKQLLLLVGAKLEHIIARLAQESIDMMGKEDSRSVKPSDEYFWFTRPSLVLHLLHFILFQNSFEIAFLFWIWMGSKSKAEKAEPSSLIGTKGGSPNNTRQSNHMIKESTQIDEQAIIMMEDATTSTIELPHIVHAPFERPNASNSYSSTNIH
ncbi:hypothetical protein JHK86_042171 [Glycine max]|nr:hypothetical protein JHK86_042171 [Glycine max]